MPNAAAPAPLPSPAAPGGLAYQRRRPEDTTLYQVVRDNLRTLYAAIEEGYTSAPFPAFVRAELEGYLDCGLLCRGYPATHYVLS